MKSATPCIPGLFNDPIVPLPRPHQLAHEQETARRENNKQKVLARLLEGPATGDELDAIAGRRFGARIFDLGKDGWDIRSEAITRSQFRYTLKGRKAVQEHL